MLAAFDSTGRGPEGYANLMKDLAGAYDPREMVLEVIAELNQDGTKAARLIRVTADQSLLENEKNGRLVAETGQFHFRGQALAWVTIDNGPLLSGHHPEGLVNMSVDFASQTANINLRTENSLTSEVEVKLEAENLPFNIRTGAFGGAVVMQVGTDTLGRSGDIPGHLRGNVGGTPVWTNSIHDLTTSGLFTGAGTTRFGGDDKTPKDVRIDGMWFGRDLPRD
ncbi:hypothetical protein [Falsigemmobacter faecalis]|uniref:Uncharacterized protein n=1 Tax=Falsigemmobacter faecalis TaxID=2488730 RepID=A0A3P3DXK7_9RHOB|nr:hypothetical protein [Falsigemmobacter faecalis]RRH78222.1 hypothetical protein EG244_01905 [Falsigemmobacter faecalis]